MSRLLQLLVGLLLIMALADITMAQRARPAAGGAGASAGAVRTPGARAGAGVGTPTTPSTDTPTSAGGPGRDKDKEKEKEKEPEKFDVEDLAGTFAFKASGFVAIGGPGSADQGPGSYPPETEAQNLFVAVEGRICSDKKGRCAINAWVNVNGYQTFHIDTANPSMTMYPANQECTVTVDEFGQGTFYIPIALTPDEKAATSIVDTPLAGSLPTSLVIRFTAFDDSHYYFEVDGCGPQNVPALTDTLVASTYRPHYPPPSPAALINACDEKQQMAGRVPIALIGEASRQTFRCSNCKKDDFAFFNGKDEEVCPAELRVKDKEPHSGGPRGGRGNGGWGPDSLDL